MMPAMEQLIEKPANALLHHFSIRRFAVPDFHPFYIGGRVEGDSHASALGKAILAFDDDLFIRQKSFFDQ